MKPFLRILTLIAVMAVNPIGAQTDFGDFFGAATTEDLGGSAEEISPIGDTAPIRVEILTDRAGSRWARVPADVAETRELAGEQDGIDENNNHVRFNADENIGDSRKSDLVLSTV